MRRIATCLLPALAASVSLAACGGSSYSAGSSSKSAGLAGSASRPAAASSGSSAGAIVKTAANSSLGATILTNAGGMTLYRLSAEQPGRFICTSAACLQVWHPLAASTAAAANAAVGSLGAVKRPDGSEQVTYKGMPLYTFGSDRQPGDAKGQGLKDVGTWNAVTVAAATPAAPAKSPPPRYGTASPY
jgi:predicted lipoprotein with Yx(FWY)xxD motif